MQKIILASQSPRRHQLLQWAEVPFDLCIAHTEEQVPLGISASEVPLRIAIEKAEAARQLLGQQGVADLSRPILAADTLVLLQGSILGKPTDAAQARQMLSELAGKTHQVVTGVAILHLGGAITFSETTEVTFHDLTAAQIEFYVEKYQPFDKAGSYAIQEWIGVVGIKAIVGDFYNVMGLPVSRVVRTLAELERLKH
jgi:septum formation protein